jgi:hypothetical protein
MIDLDLIIDQWIQPAGRVDAETVVAAMEDELARLIDETGVQLPSEATLEVSRLRVDGVLLPIDSVADAATLGVALARTIAAGLARVDRP